ncbi:DUF1217 domain-containing protein [Aliihoeflea sp. PC F10.4]
MIGTLASYQQITRNLDRSMARIEAQPLVKRETEHYLANISKVTSVEEFVDDYRLFNYAMKAFGLQDMAYAKAFMVKVLEEGVEDPDSFANKLTDKRYAEFAKAFDFARHGAEATSFNPAQQGAIGLYALSAKRDGIPADVQKAETTYYLSTISTITSADGLLANDRLLDYALRAHGLEDRADDKAFLKNLLDGGVENAAAFGETDEEKAELEAFVRAYNFAEHGAQATTFTKAGTGAMGAYLRQTLEEDAGNQNEGVRLALYFERKAGGITSWYEVLGDRALGQVVRTALGLPDSFAQADIDRQVKFFESRLDIEDFQDPEKLGPFMSRFAAMWEMNNPSSAGLSPTAVLFGQPPEFGISGDILLTIARMKS